jgi:hypothetical protein
MNNGARDTEIRLTNDRGRTVLAFIKRAYGDGTSDSWDVAVKPASTKVLAHPDKPRPVDKDTPARYLKQLPDGRRELELRGLTLRWEKVTPILDRLAENDIRAITIDQLRACLR